VAARIIILNGVGSAGKSSTAKALQAITDEPFLHVPMDAFLEMMPLRMMGHPDGMTFETIDVGGKPSVVIHIGAFLERLMRGMRAAIAAMAAEGNNLIVDDVMFGSGEAAEYRRLLAPFEHYFVALRAPLDVHESRELARGDRDIGLARWQYDRVHTGITYDLEIDTSASSPAECAAKIKAAFCL
jgi:chloramphenicol 3-O phosphotransferase